MRGSSRVAFGVEFMPDHGFRKSYRRRAGIIRDGRTLAISGGRTVRERLQDESSSDDMRMELVGMARNKIAMGVYDDPLVLERAIDRMLGE